MKKEKMLPYGYVTFSGVKLSDSQVDAYNRETQKINKYLENGKNPPEHLLNGRHNLLNSLSKKNPSKNFRGVKVYFQTITEESASNGDFEKTGEWDEIKCDSIIEAIEAIREYGYVEPSSSQFHKGIWYSTTDCSHDHDYFTKGIEKYYTLHLKGFNEDEERAIYMGLFPKRSNPKRRNPARVYEKELLAELEDKIRALEYRIKKNLKEGGSEKELVDLKVMLNKYKDKAASLGIE